ncbi:hypothetical protein CC80DRAFT_13022 [Byssothecium circinans]|uniref:Uncharacterized protein n=1 Tax=Byssothecium circinans TaxID=147558 RepID=A0A6A5UEZ5_9PLEO|nr:hypothetical protein CC80DRAFT_13022 [Byssothecium circinans]
MFFLETRHARQRFNEKKVTQMTVVSALGGRTDPSAQQFAKSVANIINSHLTALCVPVAQDWTVYRPSRSRPSGTRCVEVPEQIVRGLLADLNKPRPSSLEP